MFLFYIFFLSKLIISVSYALNISVIAQISNIKIRKSCGNKFRSFSNATCITYYLFSSFLFVHSYTNFQITIIKNCVLKIF